MQRDSQRLRAELVHTLKAQGHLRSPRIAAAFASIPRELFVPNVALAAVYSPSDAIEVKRVDGVRVSSASAPDVMAIMLEQLNVEPGQRVLEIGAGTGYNAALLSRLVGDTGRVISLDIDEDLVLGAREHLAWLGIRNVEVIQRDGALGYEEAAPFDRIILTVASRDVAPAWREQLVRPGGRLVLPLSLDGPQRSVALEQVDDHLESSSAHNCGFLPLRGLLGFGMARVAFGADDGLSLGPRGDRLPPRFQPELLEQLLRGPCTLLPSGVQASATQVRGSVLIWLMSHEPNVCTLWAHPSATFVPDMVGMANQVRGTACLLDPKGHGVAVLAWQDEAAQAGEVVVRQAVGSDWCGQRLLGLLRGWQAAGKPSDARLRVRVYPRGHPYVGQRDEVVLEQRWSRIVLSWR